MSSRVENWKIINKKQHEFRGMDVLGRIDVGHMSGTDTYIILDVCMLPRLTYSIDNSAHSVTCNNLIRS